MTNKSSAKQHGAHLWPQRRPKSGMSHRNNKARAAMIREALREKGLNC